MGASVLSMATLGRGAPDIAVGWRGSTYLAEIKDGKKKWKLTDDQQRFHSEWKAPIAILESVDQAIAWLQGL